MIFFSNKMNRVSTFFRILLSYYVKENESSYYITRAHYCLRLLTMSMSSVCLLQLPKYQRRRRSKNQRLLKQCNFWGAKFPILTHSNRWSFNLTCNNFEVVSEQQTSIVFGRQNPTVHSILFLWVLLIFADKSFTNSIGVRYFLMSQINFSSKWKESLNSFRMIRRITKLFF